MGGNVQRGSLPPSITIFPHAFNCEVHEATVRCFIIASKITPEVSPRKGIWPVADS